MCSQRIQSKTVIFTRFQQISISGRIRFGTRGSEVQILSPRPIFSVTCKPAIPTIWDWPRCSSAERCVNIELLDAYWVQHRLQKHLQSAGLSSFTTRQLNWIRYHFFDSTVDRHFGERQPSSYLKHRFLLTYLVFAVRSIVA